MNPKSSQSLVKSELIENKHHNRP